jgi:hypothetical protein
MALSDTAIRALKPEGSAFAVTVERGLSLQIATSGSKLWRYRYLFARKARVMSFGSYPEGAVSLIAARFRLARWS